MVEEAVGPVVVRHVKAECVGSLWDAEQVLRSDSVVDTDRVALNLVVFARVAGGKLWAVGVVVIEGMEILRVVVEVVIVIHDHGLFSVHVLDDSERIKLDLVRDGVLTLDQDAVLQDFDELGKFLLYLDLIPLDANASARNGEPLFFLCGLDLHLHDAFLEERQVQVEMTGTEVNTACCVLTHIIHIHLMLVQVKLCMD